MEAEAMEDLARLYKAVLDSSLSLVRRQVLQFLSVHVQRSWSEHRFNACGVDEPNYQPNGHSLSEPFPQGSKGTELGRDSRKSVNALDCSSPLEGNRILVSEPTQARIRAGPPQHDRFAAQQRSGMYSRRKPWLRGRRTGHPTVSEKKWGRQSQCLRGRRLYARVSSAPLSFSILITSAP